MSGDDELLPEGVPSFDDPAYAELRDALADAKASEPMPADVVARLDAVLADLGATSGPGAAGPEADDPAPLRARSRLAPRLLAAAAAVVVLAGGGVGLAKVLTHNGSVATDKVESAAGPSATPTNATGLAPSVRSPAIVTALPRLSSAHFGQDVSRLMLSKQLSTLDALSGTATGAGSSTTNEFGPSQPTSGTADSRPVPAPQPASTPAHRGSSVPSEGTGGLASLALPRSTPAACDPQIPGTTTRPILLDGRPAVLVIHQAVAGYRLVEARDCTGTAVLASTRLPA